MDLHGDQQVQIYLAAAEKGNGERLKEFTYTIALFIQAGKRMYVFTIRLSPECRDISLLDKRHGEVLGSHLHTLTRSLLYVRGRAPIRIIFDAIYIDS